MPSTSFRSSDNRVHVTVIPGRPAYVYVTHEGLTEGEVDATLQELAAQIPAPCCVIMLPRMNGIADVVGIDDSGGGLEIPLDSPHSDKSPSAMTQERTANGGVQVSGTETLPTQLGADLRALGVRFGHLLFAFRDYLFPLTLVLLVITTKPGLPFGSERLDEWMDVCGIVVALLGQGCRLLAVGSVRNIRRGGQQKRIAADALIQSGLFAHTRNPLYLGNLFILTGLALIANCRWWYLLALPGFVGSYWAIVLAEEEFLLGKFGQEYVEYARAVNRFVPNVHGLRHSLAHCVCDWRRVGKKEFGIACAWGSTAIFLLLWEQWERFGFTPRGAGTSASLLVFLAALLAGRGAVWLTKPRKTRA